MKIQSSPTGKRLNRNEILALPEGAIVRNLEGETGTVVKRRTTRMVLWDDGCITILTSLREWPFGIWRVSA